MSEMQAAKSNDLPRPGFSVEMAPHDRVRVEYRHSVIEGPVGTMSHKPVAWLHLPDLDAAMALRDALSTFITFHMRQFGVPGAVKTPEGGAGAQPPLAAESHASDRAEERKPADVE